MTAKTLVAVVSLLLSATTIVLAQSQPNYGPNGPGKGNCYGAPYSGAAGAKCTVRGGGYR
jgi:hypothetical protein